MVSMNKLALSEIKSVSENNAPVSEILSLHSKVRLTGTQQHQYSPLEIQCPEDISIFTDINDCTAEANNLNLRYTGGAITTLTWKMTGATNEASPQSGINQINNYRFYEGVTFITYTVTDSLGMIKTCSFSVTVSDNEAPVIEAPKNLYIQCDDRIPSAHTTLQAFINAGGSASDNCALLPRSFELTGEVKDNKNCPYVLTRTYQVSDVKGNTSITKQLIFVSDEDSTYTQSATSISGASVKLSFTKTNVLCSGNNNGAIRLNLSGTTGTVTFKWTTANGDGIVEGLKDQTSLTNGDYNIKIYENGIFLTELDISILVIDDESPIIYAPEDIEIDCNQTVPQAFRNWAQFENAGGSASDNCKLNYASFRLVAETRSSTVCPYTINRTYQISDENGNRGLVVHQILVKEDANALYTTPRLKSGMLGTITAIANGNWNDPNTWDLGRVPLPDDDVIIPNLFTVTIDGAAACNDITIQAGGTLNHSGSTTLEVNGNWTNSGNYNGGADGTIEFSNSGSVINGTTSFTNLFINAGSDVSAFVSVTSTINVNNLRLENGLLRIDGGTTTITHLNDPVGNPLHNTIPASAGIEVNSGVLNTGDFSITNEGLIQITGGTANFGNSTGNEVHTQVDGAFIVTGGAVNIAGRLYNSAAGTLSPPGGITSGISISGGIITLATVGNGLSSTGSLNVTQAGNFDFSGGTIVFQNPSTAATELDIGLISGGGTKNTTGGTFPVRKRFNSCGFNF